MDQLEIILQKLKTTELPIDDDFILSREELIAQFDKIKEVFNNPKLVIEDYIPGICFRLQFEGELLMRRWYSYLELDGWGDTLYWIKPSYDIYEEVYELCEARVKICDAIINNLKQHKPEDNG